MKIDDRKIIINLDKDINNMQPVINQLNEWADKAYGSWTIDFWKEDVRVMQAVILDMNIKDRITDKSLEPIFDVWTYNYPGQQEDPKFNSIKARDIVGLAENLIRDVDKLKDEIPEFVDDFDEENGIQYEGDNYDDI